MTIRFTKSWNGYYEGQIVSNPAGGNTEAQLIALDYAVADLDGPDNSYELAKLATDPITGAVTGLVGPGGNELQIGVNSRIYNAPALAKWARRYGCAAAEPVHINVTGDSLVAGTGATGGANTDDTGDTYGLCGYLRRALNAPLGTVGGGYMSANDTRVTKVNGGNLTGYGPFYASAFTNARLMNAAGATLSFAVPSCTAFDVYTWEDYTAGYGRTTSQYSYAVDGGDAVTLSGTQTSGANSAMTITTGASGLGSTSHTVLLSWVAGSNAIHGIFYKGASGVSVNRFGVGGFTSSDLLGRTLTAASIDRVMRASYVSVPSDLHIIVCSHNDASQQVAQGTTPAQYKSNLQSIINYINTNPAAPPILLVTDPAPSLTETPYDYSDYWGKVKELASENSNVAAIVWAEVMGSYTLGNSEGAYSDFVHQTNKGYARFARFLSQTLMSVAP